jgi:hypothetical protein
MPIESAEGHERQLMKLVEPLLGLYVPTEQPVHATLPKLGLYVPAGHCVQEGWPVFGLYVPAGHCMHTPGEV